MLDDRGFVAETNATNVFLVTDGTVRTPTTRACPEGITRETVLELCAAQGITCAVGDWSLAEVYTADEVFVTGTMGGVSPVVLVDGRSIGDGGRGPVTERLRAAYAELTARSGTPVTTGEVVAGDASAR
jgi:branched-chain amino acid aminotransferase